MIFPVTNFSNTQNYFLIFFLPSATALPTKTYTFSKNTFCIAMAKGSKLKEALQREKGVDQKVEFRKKQQKEGEKKAEKRKRSKVDEGEEDAILDKAVEQAEKSVKAEKSAPPAKKSKKNKAQRQAKRVQANAKAEDAVMLGGDAAIEAALEDDSDDDMEEEEEVAGQDKEWETDDEEELAMVWETHSNTSISNNMLTIPSDQHRKDGRRLFRLRRRRGGYPRRRWCRRRR